MDMSTMRIFVTVCAMVLLAAGLGGHFADAEGCLSGIKCLFSGQKGYATLANHLYKATQSDKLVDNIKAAKSLLSEQSGSKQNFKELALAFGSLEGDSSFSRGFCSTNNLANLRRVAEGLRDGGNLGPKKITDPILRLNKIVIKVIEDARKVCGEYLPGKWQEPWKPRFTEWNMQLRIEYLDGVDPSYLYEEYLGSTASSSSSRRESQAESISTAIRRSEKQAANPSDPNDVQLGLSEDKFELTTQLIQYVYNPCSEFVRLKEAKEVLAPFNDMLMSWFVVSTGLLDKYYENKDAYRPHDSTSFYEAKVQDLAHSYRACQRFLATPAGDLAKKISKFRRDDGRDD